MNRRILIVDDEARVRTTFERSLQFEFDVHTASNGEEALQILKTHGPFAVIMADMNMPGMNGVMLLERVQELAPDTIRIMLTGNAYHQTARDAVNKGHVFSFLHKPTEMPEVVLALEEGVRRHMTLATERELLENTLGGVINTFSELISLRDPGGFNASQSLSDYALTIARMQGMTDLWPLEVAMRLASIGRLAVPAEILRRADAGEILSPGEQKVIDRIPEAGARLLRNIPRLEEVARIIQYQAKGFDGSGQPQDEVKGLALPWGARILTVVRAFLAEEARWGTSSEALAALKLREPSFDPEILFNLEELVVPTEPPAPEGDPHPDQDTGPLVLDLQVSQLKTGLTLAMDVRTTAGETILPKGLRLGAAHLEQLRNLEELGRLPGSIQVAVN